MSERMPVLFIGHGSPMNAIEDNKFVRIWEEIAEKFEKPKAILAVSAHWVTDKISINDSDKPKTIYDMYGFPRELYQKKYDAPGAPELAKETISLLDGKVKVDRSWGIDHGTWSVLCKMYPKADIPVCQLSLDLKLSPETYFDIGNILRPLRKKGILILGSGNVVHNLSLIDFDKNDGFWWADEFDNYIKEAIIKRDFESVINYKLAGESSKTAFFTSEHFYPLLPVLGASSSEDELFVYNDECMYGSMSMTCYMFK